MNADAPSDPQSGSFMSPSDPMSALLARNWWVVVLRGLAAVIFGLIALFVPGAVLLTLALVFAAYLLVDGVLGMVAAARAASHHERWGLLLLEALVNVGVGMIAAVFPAAAVLGFVLLIGIWAVVTGVLVIAASIRLHVSHGRWWLAVRRHRLDSVGGLAAAGAVDGCRGADLVGGRLCDRVRHHAAGARVPSARPAREAASAFSP